LTEARLLRRLSEAFMKVAEMKRKKQAPDLLEIFGERRDDDAPLTILPEGIRNVVGMNDVEGLKSFFRGMKRPTDGPSNNRPQGGKLLDRQGSE
jgi:hypothetical protein